MATKKTAKGSRGWVPEYAAAPATLEVARIRADMSGLAARIRQFLGRHPDALGCTCPFCFWLSDHEADGSGDVRHGLTTAAMVLESMEAVVYGAAPLPAHDWPFIDPEVGRRLAAPEPDVVVPDDEAEPDAVAG